MTVTVSKWGNSLAVRIPKDALQAAGLKEGDVLEVRSEGGRLMLVPSASSPSLDELIAKITPENVHGEMFGAPVGAKVW